MSRKITAVYPILVLVLLQGASFCPLRAQQAKSDSTKSARDDSTQKKLDAAALEAELARELGVSAGESQTPPAATADVPTGDVRGTVARTGTSLNPNISVIGTFFGAGTSNNVVQKPVNLGLKEAEFSFQAYVDPYAKADFFAAFGNDFPDPFAAEAGAEEGGHSAFSAELEEGYLTTLALPHALQVKAGKFLSNFGKLNTEHSHAHKFVDLPRIYINNLGEEGLVESGVSINWLIPNPYDLYEELTVEITSPIEDGPSFSPDGKNLLYLLHLKNFVELNENTTVELGLTGVHGLNDAASHASTLGAFDLTIKWKPLRFNRYKSFEWLTEGLFNWRETEDGTIRSKGFYSSMLYQVGKRWFVGGRYDYSEFPGAPELSEKAYSALISYYATEFQKVELQFQHGLPASGRDFNQLMLRSVFVIGAHGAHKY